MNRAPLRRGRDAPSVEQMPVAGVQGARAWARAGQVHARLGRTVEALGCFERACALFPADANLHNERAILLQQLGRHDEALEAIARIVALQPENVIARFNQGLALAALGQHEEALACYRQTVDLLPPGALRLGLLSRARSFKAMTRLLEALADLDRAIGSGPEDANLRLERGTVLLRLKRHAEALADFDLGLQVDPGSFSLHNEHGNALFGLRRVEEALGSYRRALSLRPDSATASANLGAALLALHRAREAVGYLEAAVQHAGDRPTVLCNLALARSALQQPDRAEEALARARAADPESAEAKWNEALFLLLWGRLEKAWPLFEARWQCQFDEPQRHRTIPAWSGAKDVAGARILLWAEQGLGDAIQFCRYATRVAELGAKVLLEVPPSLRLLMQSLSPNIGVYAQGETLPVCDLQAPLMSLPGLFGTKLSTIPAPVPYLHADAAKTQAWRQRLGNRVAGLRVGVAVSGRAAHRDDAQRSMPLEQLRPLFGRGQLVLLQKELRQSDARTFSASCIFDPRAHLHDFSDTAALVATLDLVISVDTSVAHLAGALGKPVWVLLPSLPDWRWMLERVDSPWYPSARLFRRPPDADWSVVTGKMCEALDHGAV